MTIALRNLRRQKVYTVIDMFVLAGLIVGALALLTITAQAFRAAQVNPADTLRYE